jgi:hypothetical protein
LTGPFESRRVEPAVIGWDDDLIATRYGWIELPQGRTVVATHVIREESGSPCLDWLDVCIPLGGLGELYPSFWASQFGDEDQSATWQPGVDGVLVSIAERIAAAANFVQGIIGFEVSGEFDGVDVPEDRGVGYVTPSPSGVVFHPPSR